MEIDLEERDLSLALVNQVGIEREMFSLEACCLTISGKEQLE